MTFARTVLAVAALGAAAAAAPAPKAATDFTMTAIDGEPMPFAKYKGKVLLVVNTASMCGFTPQYEGLQKLQDTYAPKGFTVIGIPSDNFGGQEYSDNKEIKKFCSSKFGIKFPMTERVDVVGPKAAPFYQWAKANLGEQSAPKWNFHKYLVGRDGKLIAYYPSKVTPQSPELTSAIEKAIAG
ncbi:MAG: glutathione peroxidase [Sphingomonadaceae bacterium]|nr:glutathione peroxidase [Sphingomonadaceae bacterium]